MKKMLAMAVILFLLLSITLVVAEELGSQGLPKPKIITVGVLGRGLAISSEDPKDFKVLKMGIARLKVFLGREKQEMSAGILWLDENRYLLKNVQIAEGTTSADVYLNNTKVGSISVSLTERGDTEIWVGTLSLDNKSYNVNILEGQRRFRGIELGEKTLSICEKYPGKCRDVAKRIGNKFCEKLDDKYCREKIKEFCEEHPDDQRCIAAARVYCKDNLDDARCRNMLKDFCKGNANNEGCVRFCGKFPKLCALELGKMKKLSIKPPDATVEHTSTTLATVNE